MHVLSSRFSRRDNVRWCAIVHMESPLKVAFHTCMELISMVMKVGGQVQQLNVFVPRIRN